MKKNKKIAIILFGNYITDGRVQRTATALAKKHDVRVFVTTDNIKNYPKKLDDIDIELVTLKTKKLSKHPIVQVIKTIEYYIAVINRVKEYNPDIIFCNDVYTIFFGWYFKKLKKKKFIYDSHELWKDTMHHYAYNSKLFKILSWVEKKTISSADAVITVNRSILEILKQDYNLNLPTVIMNISEPQKEDLFATNNKKSNIIRDVTGLDKEKKIVLYIGALSKGRGLEQIIESVQSWSKDIVLAILGSGALETNLKNLCKKKSLEDRVFFLGLVPQNEVLLYSDASDAGIMAIQKSCLSYYYCLPNKFFQTIQQKKPILSSNFPELERIITNYHLGLTFDPSKPKSIASKVNELFDSKFTISKDGYSKYLKDFNWINEKNKLLKLVERIINA